MDQNVMLTMEQAKLIDAVLLETPQGRALVAVQGAIRAAMQSPPQPPPAPDGAPDDIR